MGADSKNVIYFTMKSMKDLKVLLHYLYVLHGNKISYKLDKGYIVDIVLHQHPCALLSSLDFEAVVGVCVYAQLDSIENVPGWRFCLIGIYPGMSALKTWLLYMMVWHHSRITTISWECSSYFIPIP